MPDPTDAIQKARDGTSVLSRFKRSKLAVFATVVTMAGLVMARFPTDSNVAIWSFIGVCSTAGFYLVSQGFVDVQKEKTNSDTIDGGGGA